MRHWLTLERIFIENRIYKRIEYATTRDEIKYEVYAGLEPFADQIERAVTDDDIERLLEIPIRRISQYDIDKNREQIAKATAGIRAVKKQLKDMTATTIDSIRALLAKYGERYPRRTEITTFEAVDVRAVARQNLRVAYDPETGFFGTEVKGDAFQLQVSEYDRILIVSRDGSYRIIGPESKVLIPEKVVHIGLFDQTEGQVFTVVYRDADRFAFAKKVHIKGFIRDKEYELIKDRKGRLDLFSAGEADLVLHLDFVPRPRQRVSSGEFDLASLELTGVTARGRRLAPKPVARIKRLTRADAAAHREANGAVEPDSDQPADDDQLDLFVSD